jgi:hypothetical protein
MSQNEQVSRYEVNRSVRMVITRHDVDLSRIDFSYMGRTVYFNGELARQDREFSAREVENIIKEITALPYVMDIHFDLQNWMIASSGGSWDIKPLKKSTGNKSAPRLSSFADSTIIIDEAENLRDVLDDIEAELKTRD